MEIYGISLQNMYVNSIFQGFVLPDILLLLLLFALQVKSVHQGHVLIISFGMVAFLIIKRVVEYKI